jgi:NarL family two-component system response regulator LiaR
MDRNTVPDERKQVMTEEIIKVMIVDDHLLVRDGIELLLSTFDDIEVAAVVESGENALAFCQQEQPDVILMDMLMPDQDGPEAIDQILKSYPEIKVIALTSFVEEDLVVRAIQAGAIGYLLKNVSADKLAEAIRAAMQGQSTIEATAAQVLLQASKKSAQVGDDLTERERQVLALIAEGMTNKEIAQQLSLSHGTVRVYVSQVLAKLEVGNRTEAARMALEHKIK